MNNREMPSAEFVQRIIGQLDEILAKDRVRTWRELKELYELNYEGAMARLRALNGEGG